MNTKGRKRLWMSGFFAAVFLSVLLGLGLPVSAEVLDYDDMFKSLQEVGSSPAVKEVKDEKGQVVKLLPCRETLYVSAKRTPLRKKPGDGSKRIDGIYLGSRVTRTGVCENGWSRVVYEEKGKDPQRGYIKTSDLSQETQITKFSDYPDVVKEAEILDYPAKKEGLVVGTIRADQQVERTGMIDYVWSRILYKDDKGKEQVGYVPTTCLNAEGMVLPGESSNVVAAGVIHKSKGTGIFADAVDQVTADYEGGSVEGVRVGVPEAASSDAVLTPLGTFRITHYCPCSICCGPWANGITSSGVVAVTNHTIAVDPEQIPYGSKVVINGQVYVAEDCGGAIRENCIDIYVATHEEAESRGVFYTDVYLIS